MRACTDVADRIGYRLIRYIVCGIYYAQANVVHQIRRVTKYSTKLSGMKISRRRVTLSTLSSAYGVDTRYKTLLWNFYNLFIADLENRIFVDFYRLDFLEVIS